MGESFMKQLENQLAAKVYEQKAEIRKRREEHVTSMMMRLESLRNAEYRLEQVRKARKLLEVAEDNES